MATGKENTREQDQMEKFGPEDTRVSSEEFKFGPPFQENQTLSHRDERWETTYRQPQPFGWLYSSRHGIKSGITLQQQLLEEAALTGCSSGN